MMVSVVGKGRDCPRRVMAIAGALGEQLGLDGHTVITGGLGGVMRAAATGCVAAGGAAIAFLPLGHERDPEYPGLQLRTGLPLAARNIVTGSACDVMLAVYGSHGTMQELAVALDRGVPVAQVETMMWHDAERAIPHLSVGDVRAWLRGR